MTLPNASTRLSSQAGVAPVSTDLCAVWAPCVTLADGVPRQYSNLSAALDAHGYCEGLEYAGLHLAGAGKPFLFVPLPIGTAGAIMRQESVHTGTSKVTVAAGSDGVLADVEGRLKVTNGGTIGTDQILLSLSLDDNRSVTPVRLGTASSYVIPHVGMTVSFGAGTLVDGDEILVWRSKAPVIDSAGITTGLAAMIAQQRIVRSWVFVGDVSTLALAQAVEDAANAYETAERFIVAKAQLRDRRVIKSSRQRHAMVGTPTLTFAEVGATGDTITRDTGSWVTDGFAVGDWITVTGSVSNNVSGKITGVTATVLTLDTTDLAAETLVTASAGGRVTGEASFVFATTTITRNTGSWVTDGFAVGDSVTIAGSALNDAEAAVITTLTATVMTCSASTFSAETIGSCTCTISLTESKTAHVAANDALVASVTGSERVDLGHGRLKKNSPITGYNMRRPVQWADSIRSYVRDLSKTTWEKDYGPLEGWTLDADEHDERVDGGAIDARFTCARTWGNGPTGAFIAESITRATDGSVLSLTHNMYVASLVQTIVQRRTEGFVGATLTLDPTTGYATRDALAKLAAKVNGDLKRNSKSITPGDIPRWSSATWTPATDDVLNVPGAVMNGTCVLKINGTIFSVATSVEVS